MLYKNGGTSYVTTDIEKPKGQGRFKATKPDQQKASVVLVSFCARFIA